MKRGGVAVTQRQLNAENRKIQRRAVNLAKTSPKKTGTVSQNQNLQRRSVIVPGGVPKLSASKQIQMGVIQNQNQNQILGAGSLNTHFFDGKMKNVIESFSGEFESSDYVTKVDKIKSVQKLREKVLDLQEINIQGMRCFDTIAGSPDSPGNYDRVNNLDAFLLLYLVSCHKDDPEYVSLLSHQLNEMASGMCPQGRTTRLLQVLYSLRK